MISRSALFWAAPSGWALIVGTALIGAAFGCSSLQADAPAVQRAAQQPQPSVATFEIPMEEAWSAQVSGGFGPNAGTVRGNLLAVGMRDGHVALLDAETGEALGSGEVGVSIEGGVTLLNDPRRLAIPVAGAGRGLLVYDLSETRIVWALQDAPHATAPALAGGVLVAGDIRGARRGLNPVTGDVLWVTRPDTTAAYRSPPRVLPGGDVVMASTRGRIDRLDPQTGAIRWSVDTERPVERAVAVSPRHLIVPTTRGMLLSLDTDTGRERWRFEATARTPVRLAAPTVAGDTVFVGGTDGRLRAFDIHTGRRIWTAVVDGVIDAAPLVIGTHVVIGTMREKVIVLDRGTGERRWETALDGRIKSDLLYAAGYLLILREPRRVIAFRPAATPSSSSLSARTN